MPNLDQRLREQHALFESQLDELVKTLRGRWVIFAHGAVQSVHEMESDAISAALKRYKAEDPFIIVQVSPQD